MTKPQVPKPQVPKPQVLIVGAGPTGLVLALRLASHGVALRIIDKKGEPGHASRAMAVHARTLEFYDQSGFAQEVVDAGIRIEAMHLRESGKEVAAIALHDIGEDISPYPFVLSYPQDDHERFLVGKLQALGVAVEWNTALASFSQNGAGVQAVLRGKAGEEQAEFAYLCGCDGASSVTRQALDMDFPGGTYEHLYYVADVKTAGEFRTDGYMNLWADGFALMLPVRSSGMHRLIGIAPELPDDREPVFEDIRPHAEKLIGIAIEECNWFSSYRVHHRVAQHFRQARCFLAGDAAHIHSPVGGQGMNTGIGDAVNLAWKLAQVLQTRADAAVLDSYESERMGFARELVHSTDRAFKAIVDDGLRGKLLRTWFAPHVFPLLTGFAPTRKAIFKTVSQVRIHYGDSPLSEGKAGDVQGGDRLPWVAGQDNFLPLRSMDWQLHVYGAITAELAQAAKALQLPVHALPWSDAAAKAGLKRDAAYLIRPDAYVAWVSRQQDVSGLHAYVKRHGLRFTTS